MSIRPHASRVLATRFSSCALSEIRAVTAIASPPLARIAAATSSQGARLRAEITTRLPASARASAMARPMPRLDPVTIATFPDKSKSFMTPSEHLISPSDHAGSSGFSEAVSAIRFRSECQQVGVDDNLQPRITDRLQLDSLFASSLDFPGATQN